MMREGDVAYEYAIDGIPLRAGQWKGVDAQHLEAAVAAAFGLEPADCAGRLTFLRSNNPQWRSAVMSLGAAAAAKVATGGDLGAATDWAVMTLKKPGGSTGPPAPSKREGQGQGQGQGQGGGSGRDGKASQWLGRAAKPGKVPVSHPSVGTSSRQKTAAADTTPRRSSSGGGGGGGGGGPGVASSRHKSAGVSGGGGGSGSDTVAPPARALLGRDQRAVYEAVVDDSANVFFTGSAGTGKSWVLAQVAAGLRRRNARSWSARSKGTVDLTASTGIAAANIGGVTIHSFAGVGLGRAPAEELLRDMLLAARKRWLGCKTLIIDEISMLDGALFDKLDVIARTIRTSSKPFGGIQLVLCGDFHQLPPVGLGANGCCFCFQSECWNSAVARTLELKQARRQHDPELLRLLESVRHGKVTPEALRLLERAQANTLDVSDGIAPTRLHARNTNVDRVNEQELQKLPGSGRAYRARDHGPQAATLLKNVRAPSALTLKTGAQVMLISNLDVPQGLVNGVRGVVCGFRQPSRRPAKLGAGSSDLLPVVRFRLKSSAVVEQLVMPESWEIAQGDHVVASRTQLPLKLAWAITIHKSQGMTITKLSLSLKGVFEPGMAYVALSRGVALDNIHLVDVDPRKITTHPAVQAFALALAGGTPSTTSGAASAAASGARAAHAATPDQLVRIRKKRDEAIKRRDGKRPRTD